MIEREFETLVTTLKTLETVYNETKTRYQQIDSKVRDIDDYIMDVRHDIELKKLDACGMSKKYKQLQNLLKLRREYKDYSMIAEHMVKGLNKMTISKVLKNTQGSYKGLKTREYRERASNAVKQSLNEEIKNEL